VSGCYAGPMSDPITLDFTYTEAQYVAGVRLHLSHRHRYRVDVPLAVAVALLGGAGLVAGVGGVIAPVLLAVGLVYLGLLALGWFWVPVRQYRSQPKLRDAYLLSFAEEGIEFRTVDVQSSLLWAMYLRVLADADVYLLYYARDGFTVLPRDAFSPGEEAGFRALLKRKVPEFVER